MVRSVRGQTRLLRRCPHARQLLDGNARGDRHTIRKVVERKPLQAGVFGRLEQLRDANDRRGHVHGRDPVLAERGVAVVDDTQELRGAELDADLFENLPANRVDHGLHPVDLAARQAPAPGLRITSPPEQQDPAIDHDGGATARTGLAALGAVRHLITAITGVRPGGARRQTSSRSISRYCADRGRPTADSPPTDRQPRSFLKIVAGVHF